MLDIRCESLKVALRDHKRKNESNTWMAEDAVAKRKNILVIDDINDTGATFDWIKKDWGINGHTNVRFAVLTENLSSEFEDVKYWAHEVNKAEEDVWLVYPWENVGAYRDE
jgi:hypoxanthine phosphoribosyltransferase